MANILIEETTLKALANAIRDINGETTSYLPIEMVDAVNKILDSATYILVDDNGNEAVGVVVDNEVVFDATANDIRQGKVAATSEGVTVGSKVIPSYHTTEGSRVIPVGSQLDITFGLDELDLYDYTKLQVIICPFRTSLAKSVGAEKVVINDNVYEVGNTISLSVVTKDISSKHINLGISNEGTVPYILRYFTYKEIY